MWVKQFHKPPMTVNGKFIPPIKMVIFSGGWCKWLCFLVMIEVMIGNKTTWTSGTSCQDA